MAFFLCCSSLLELNDFNVLNTNYIETTNLNLNFWLLHSVFLFLAVFSLFFFSI